MPNRMRRYHPVVAASGTSRNVVAAAAGQATARAFEGSTLFPNEPAGNVMLADFDASHPDGVLQNGWSVVGTVDIIDAAWSPNGKAARFTVPAGIRVPLTNVQPGAGAYAGMTVITATGLAAAWAANVHSASRPLALGDVGGSLGALINHVSLGLDGEFFVPPTVIDADTLGAPFDLTGYPAYTSGGYVAFIAGVDGGYIYPPDNTRPVSTIYNTTFYTSGLVRLDDDYKSNLGAGQKCCFVAGRSYYNEGVYGAGWWGFLGDGTWETVGDAAGEDGQVFTGSAFSADGNPGGVSQLGTHEVLRGVPKRIEHLMIADQEGVADGICRMWFDKSAPASADLEKTGFQLTSTGPESLTGYGHRGFSVYAVANTFGGGGVIPPYPVTFDVAYFRASGGYARAGEQPDHWDLSVSDSTPNVGDTVRVTAVLKDANNARLNACVMNFAVSDGFDDLAGYDVQAQVNNGASWSYVSNSSIGLANIGQFQIDVLVNNPGVTTIDIRDIARANNYVRYGDWREGQITVTGS